MPSLRRIEALLQLLGHLLGSLLELLHLEGFDSLELIPQYLLLHRPLVPPVTKRSLQLLHIRRVGILLGSLCHVLWLAELGELGPGLAGKSIELSSHTR